MKTPWKDVLLVLMVGWVVRGMFMMAVPGNARSFDAYAFEVVGHLLDAGKNPYHETALLNFPPLWMQVVFGLEKLSNLTGVAFFRLLQLTLIAIESVVIVLSLQMVHRLSPTTDVRRLGLAAFALNPAGILFVCQHCNFDMLVGLWVLLAVFWLLKFNASGNPTHWLAACLFVGLGILTKTVPLILIPLLAGGLRRADWLTRCLGAVLVLGPASLGMSILVSLCPHDAIYKVLFYHSIGGVFGISGLLGMVFQPSWIPGALFAVLLAGWFAVGWRWELEARRTVLCAALVLAAIPALGPGYSTQYLFWFMPLLAITYPLFDNRWRWALIGLGIIAAATYLFEYSFFVEYGCSALFLLDPTIQVGTTFPPDVTVNAAPPLALYCARLAYGHSIVWVNLPLFLAYLVLLAMGYRRLTGTAVAAFSPSNETRTGN